MNDFSEFFSNEIAGSVTDGTLTTEIKEVINAVYLKVFRKDVLQSCKNCFSDAYFELYNLWRNDISKFTALFMCEYKVRAGEVLSEFGSSENMITKDNVTNETAEYYLSLNENYSRSFDLLPEDWRERIASKEISVPEEEKEQEEIKTDGETPKTKNTVKKK